MEPINSNKNKLNSKKNWLFKPSLKKKKIIRKDRKMGM